MKTKKKIARPPVHHRRRVIGRMARVITSAGLRLASVMDAGPGGKAKRVRVQDGDGDKGKVLMPADYNIVEFVD